MFNVNTTSIEGKKFEDSNGKTWQCIGFAQNATFLVVAVRFDAINNRSIINTFKLDEVELEGDARL